MKIRSIILLIGLMGSFAIIGGEIAKIGELNGLEGTSNHNYSKISLSLVLWERLQNAVGSISGLYLFTKLSELIREHPMTSMFVAILVGIITDENKENIIAGIRKLRNSVSRFMGFDSKKTEENKKDEKKRKVRFVDLTDLSMDKIPTDKNVVFNV